MVRNISRIDCILKESPSYEDVLGMYKKAKALPEPERIKETERIKKLVGNSLKRISQRDYSLRRKLRDLIFEKRDVQSEIDFVYDMWRDAKDIRKKSRLRVRLNRLERKKRRIIQKMKRLLRRRM